MTKVRMHSTQEKVGSREAAFTRALLPETGIRRSVAGLFNITDAEMGSELDLVLAQEPDQASESGQAF